MGRQVKHDLHASPYLSSRRTAPYPPPSCVTAGETLKEAIAINQSLSMLGTVINALTDTRSNAHIPYRSSKLTYLLEESLGGNSHTVMLAACSPSTKSYFETSSTTTLQSIIAALSTHCNVCHSLSDTPLLLCVACSGTLQYAVRAKMIVTNPKANYDLDKDVPMEEEVCASACMQAAKQAKHEA